MIGFGTVREMSFVGSAGVVFRFLGRHFISVRELLHASWHIAAIEGRRIEHSLYFRKTSWNLLSALNDRRGVAGLLIVAVRVVGVRQLIIVGCLMVVCRLIVVVGLISLVGAVMVDRSDVLSFFELRPPSRATPRTRQDVFLLMVCSAVIVAHAAVSDRLY